MHHYWMDSISYIKNSIVNALYKQCAENRNILFSLKILEMLWFEPGLLGVCANATIVLSRAPFLLVFSVGSMEATNFRLFPFYKIYWECLNFL